MRACAPSSSWTQDDNCLPDFWYAVEQPTIRRVFVNFSASFAARSFRASRCPSGHGVIRGRIKQLGLAAQLGRYLTSQMEYDFVRDADIASMRKKQLPWNVAHPHAPSSFAARWEARD